MGRWEFLRHRCKKRPGLWLYNLQEGITKMPWPQQRNVEAGALPDDAGKNSSLACREL
jgi:hypothetical protein